jgi:hypothetical protein
MNYCQGEDPIISTHASPILNITSTGGCLVFHETANEQELIQAKEWQYPATC